MTSTHEWDPSVLDYSHPDGDGEPAWAIDPQHIDLLDHNCDTNGLYTERANITASSLADLQQPTPMTSTSPRSITQANQHNVKSETPDYQKYRPYFGWVDTGTPLSRLP